MQSAETISMNMLEQQDWKFPVPIAYGTGWLHEIPDITDKASSELLFIS